ncbi:hypothetical protein [Methanochimaera problematica]|nr:hypothetical protein [Methanoplanus sp. FWC-SCC4]
MREVIKPPVLFSTGEEWGDIHPFIKPKKSTRLKEIGKEEKI